MSKKQLPHLVFGGQVTDPQTLDFDYSKIDIVGIYPSYAEAEGAWRRVVLLATPLHPSNSEI